MGGVVGGVMIFVLIGLTPGTDVVAHFGGFVAGLLLGAALTINPNLARKSVANVSAGLLFAIFVIWTWTLALRASG